MPLDLRPLLDLLTDVPPQTWRDIGAGLADLVSSIGRPRPRLDLEKVDDVLMGALSDEGPELLRLMATPPSDARSRAVARVAWRLDQTLVRLLPEAGLIPERSRLRFIRGRLHSLIVEVRRHPESAMAAQVLAALAA